MNRSLPYPRVALILGLTLGAQSIAGAAFAQQAESTSAGDEERTGLYKEGVALAEAGRWEPALQKFQAVVAIRSAPRALVALATAQEKTGHWLDAKRTFAKAATDARAQSDDELAKKAAASVASLESRMPRIAIRLPPGSPPAQVTLDGAPAGPTPEPLQIDPGEHRVAAAASGKRPFDYPFRASEGQVTEVVVVLSSDERSEAPAPRASRSGPPLGALVLGGAGAAAMVIGLVVRANGKSDYDEANAGCQNARCSSPAVVDSGNAARDRMLAGTLVAVGGGAALAGAGLWWGLSASAPTSKGATGLSLTLSGTF
jgi:hypothetical protein